MGGIILPGNTTVNPAVETAKTEIGGQELEYFVKPGVAPQVNVQPGAEGLALVACAAFVTQYGLVLNALIREAIIQRDDAARDKAQIEVMLIRIKTLENLSDDAS